MQELNLQTVDLNFQYGRAADGPPHHNSQGGCHSTSASAKTGGIVMFGMLRPTELDESETDLATKHSRRGDGDQLDNGTGLADNRIMG